MFKKIKYIILSVMLLLESYFIYAFIGFTIRNSLTPKLIGETTARFTGSFIMGITFLIVAIIFGVGIGFYIWLFIKKRNKKESA